MPDGMEIKDLLAIIIVAAYSSCFSLGAAVSNFKETVKNITDYQRLGW